MPSKTAVYLQHAQNQEEVECKLVTTGVVPYPTTTSLWYLTGTSRSST